MTVAARMADKLSSGRSSVALSCDGY